MGLGGRFRHRVGLRSNWSLKSEVLYNRFENNGTSFTCTVFCAVAAGKRFDNQDSVWVTRIGVNYRFASGSAYPSRY